MKKFYVILLMALMSVSMWAAPAQVPTVADLSNAGYDPQSNVVLAIYPDEEATVCREIYFVGSFNDWNENYASCTPFAELSGFDGWYVAEVPYTADFQGKPVHKGESDAFTWDFQPGETDAWVKVGGDGTKEATITAGYANQSNLAFPSAGAYVYEITYWQLHKDPCVTIPKHNYTIQLYDPEGCEEEWYVPYMAGDFDGWKGTLIPATTDDEGNKVYEVVIEDEEGHSFKFLGGMETPFNDHNRWKNQFLHKEVNGTDTTGWKYFDNIVFPAATGDTTLVFDFSKLDLYRYALCGGDSNKHSITITATMPAGVPAEGIEVVGDFGTSWDNGVALTNTTGSVYTATIEATGLDNIKFKQIGSWDVQLQCLKNGEFTNMDNILIENVWKINGDNYTITLDFGDATQYRWTSTTTGLGDNVYDNDQIDVRKVVIDGVIYIQKGDKLYDTFGVQVK